MSLQDRLNDWLQIVSQVRIEEDPEILGGRRAEEFLREYIGQRYNFKGSTLLAGRRIPSKRLRRRREIDLIVCTPKMLHLIEVKNWSGSLHDHGHVWRQIKREGQTVEHTNLVTDNIEKKEVILEFLAQSGIRCDELFWSHHLCQKVFFMNDKLVMDRSLATHPDVITRHMLDQYLARQSKLSLGQQFVRSVIELCLQSETADIMQRGLFGTMPSQTFERILIALQSVGTWDRAHLFGTRILTGDLIAMQLSGRSYTREELKQVAVDNAVNIRWTRGKVLGLIKAVTGLAPLGHVQLLGGALEPRPSDTITFHKAGEERPALRTIADIDRIVFG